MKRFICALLMAGVLGLMAVPTSAQNMTPVMKPVAMAPAPAMAKPVAPAMAPAAMPAPAMPAAAMPAPAAMSAPAPAPAPAAPAG